MRDIGKSRRKRKNPQIELELRLPPPPPPPLEPPPAPLDISEEQVDSSSDQAQDDDDVEEEFFTPGPLQVANPSKPFWDQHPFSTLVNGWGMDPFAAYSIALAFASSINGRSTGSSERSNYFWFPFAFSESQFYRDMLTSTTMREAVTSDPAKSLAVRLARYQGGLKCLNGKMTDKNLKVVTGLNVVMAVIGAICYNVSEIHTLLR